jgi:hypothetical protein
MTKINDLKLAFALRNPKASELLQKFLFKFGAAWRNGSGYLRELNNNGTPFLTLINGELDYWSTINHLQYEIKDKNLSYINTELFEKIAEMQDGKEVKLAFHAKNALVAKMLVEFLCDNNCEEIFKNTIINNIETSPYLFLSDEYITNSQHEDWFIKKIFKNNFTNIDLTLFELIAEVQEEENKQSTICHYPRGCLKADILNHLFAYTWDEVTCEKCLKYRKQEERKPIGHYFENCNYKQDGDFFCYGLVKDWNIVTCEDCLKHKPSENKTDPVIHFACSDKINLACGYLNDISPENGFTVTLENVNCEKCLNNIKGDLYPIQSLEIMSSDSITINGKKYKLVEED